MATIETMTSKERIACALALDRPDRTPLVPELWYAAVATLMGIDGYEHAISDLDNMLDVELKCFDSYGGWDGITCPISVQGDSFVPLGLVPAPPTPEGPTWQVLEQENMTYEDYDIVADIGWNEYIKQILAPRIAGWDDARYDKVNDDCEAIYERGKVEYESRGAEILFGFWDVPAFFRFSLARSMLKFTEDLYYRPGKIHKALQKVTEEYIENQIDLHDKYGHPMAPCVEERAGAFFYPLRIFEEFWWPHIERTVDALWSRGIVTFFHIDTPWDKNLPYFKRLPRGSVALDLDGTTDIFLAKEILRDHACLIGDVSATMFSLGSVQEVEDYVKRLIDEVGAGGGFMLGSGCNVPNLVKPDNFRAFLSTGKTYRGK